MHNVPNDSGTRMKKYILSLLVLLTLTACTANRTRNNWAYEEYDRMIEPTSTGDESYRDYEATIPEEPQDSDMDGWNNNFDLCPDEASEIGLAGCAPLSISETAPEFMLWYQLPIDPSGRINVFGDRFLVLTNYELGELQIYDLANGELLRNFQFPDMLNDSPTLLPQGIILKNYDQQRWRLLDYNGDEIYAANEELEIIDQYLNILVSRKDNTIILRHLDDINNIFDKFSGRYVALSTNGILAITDPASCTITFLDQKNNQNNDSFLFKPGSSICNQSIRFFQYQEYFYFMDEGNTHVISMNDPNEEYVYSGILMEQVPAGYFLVDGNQLYKQILPEGESTHLFDAGEKLIQNVTFCAQWDHIKIHVRDPKSGITETHFIFLETNNDYFHIQADDIEYLYSTNNYLAWSIGEDKVFFYPSLIDYDEINSIDTPTILNVQTAINDHLLLISGQDRQLYIYGPEIK
jgi:hypothetical protein